MDPNSSDSLTKNKNAFYYLLDFRFSGSLNKQIVAHVIMCYH